MSCKVIEAAKDMQHIQRRLFPISLLGDEIQLSPGRHCKVYADRLDRKRTKLSARSKTREYKKKRREQRERRSCKVREQENREGVHYEVVWDRWKT